MFKKIKIKFLIPILLLQLVALGVLGFIAYRFSSDLLTNLAEREFNLTIESTKQHIESAIKDRLSKSKALLNNAIFIKFSAAPFYKSDADVTVFNFQKGNGLIFSEPEVGGLVNYPIGLLANEGNRGISNMGLFPSQEYVGSDGMVRQHVYLGGSNDIDFEIASSEKLDRSQTEWFKAAMAGNIFVGRPQEMPLYLRKYDPVEIESAEVEKKENLIVIAMPHKIGEATAGVMMVTTPPDFIYNALPDHESSALIMLVDSNGNIIAESGNLPLEKSIPSFDPARVAASGADSIHEEGDLLVLHEPIDESGWTLSMFAKKSDIYGAVYELRNNILFIVAISVAIMALCVFFIIGKLLRPIIKLTNASDRMAGGELGLQIDKSSDDEIGRLTESFNKMSTSTKEMHDRLARMNFVRKQMLQIISHELKTPLNGIIGFYELLKDEVMEGSISSMEEFQECFDGLGGSIEKYRILVERLTKTTNVMTGEMKTIEEVDEPSSLIESLQAAVDEAKRHRSSIELKFEVKDFAETKVVAPSGAVKLIFEEALSNAIKYSPPDSPIEIFMSNGDAEAIIEIHDNGAGIPQKYLDEVIEPFFEVADSLYHSSGKYKEGGGGLGLGLTIIGSVLKRCGGKMRIESKEGKGTSLIISLPLA